MFLRAGLREAITLVASNPPDTILNMVLKFVTATVEFLAPSEEGLNELPIDVLENRRESLQGLRTIVNETISETDTFNERSLWLRLVTLRNLNNKKIALLTRVIGDGELKQ